jgi:hypothetical protein
MPRHVDVTIWTLRFLIAALTGAVGAAQRERLTAISLLSSCSA